MTGLSDRLHRLAADAARLAAAPDTAEDFDRLAAELAGLAAELTAPDDLVQRLIARLGRAKLRATHPGHRLFDELGLGFAGPKGFAVEDLTVRARDLAIELAPRGELASLTLSHVLTAGRDALLDLDIDLPEGATLTTFLRRRGPNGQRDGPGAKIGDAAHLISRLLSAPGVEAETASELVLAFSRLAGPIRLRRFAVAAVGR